MSLPVSTSSVLAGVDNETGVTETPLLRHSDTIRYAEKHSRALDVT
jgi:hypothetical protein